jgi:transposase
MSQHTATATTTATVQRTFPVTTGLDIACKRTYQYTVDPAGNCVSEGYIPTTHTALTQLLLGPPRRVVIEACGSTRWIKQHCEELGHEVIVANPRKLHLISKNEHKNDARDARLLAEVGQLQPHLLYPVRLRGDDCQRVRVLMAARRQLVDQRVASVNFVRAQLRTLGIKSPRCSTRTFAKRIREFIPEDLRVALEPILEQTQALSGQIDHYDTLVEKLGETEFAGAQVVRQIPGVGAVLSLAYVTTLESPEHFKRSRDVGAWVGLTPKQCQTGDKDPQMRISKCGDAELRRLLVSAATWILGPFGPDCDLRRFGERIRARGDQTSRSKARIAVARKLAGVMHKLWKTGEVYEPLRTDMNRD